MASLRTPEESDRPAAGRLRIVLLLVLLLLLPSAGCRSAVEERGEQAVAPPESGRTGQGGCRDCHDLSLDPGHAFACADCHGGVERAVEREAAHAGLIRDPAHPDRMEGTCGRCHRTQTDRLRRSLHFTLFEEINAVRRAFGATEQVADLTGVPKVATPANIGQLADDMLRRRCLRCHLYSRGEGYPETVHGTGCAGCHLRFRGGELVSHAFVRTPDDDTCLHCHYGNFVGADYHGRFERDYNWEYRTPFEPDGVSRRPYGVEYQFLAADVHAAAGMACVDCHDGDELMGGGQGVSCRSCHDPANSTLPENVRADGERRWVVGRLAGREWNIPRMRHPAHLRYGSLADCAVCHARWGFRDEGTDLLRLDALDFSPWADLAVQGILEVEQQIDAVLYGESDQEQPLMSDGVDGGFFPGIWLKGYTGRRWDDPPLCRDDAGVLRVCRPLLDLRLSWVDGDGEVIFDGVAADRSAALRPYTPHTMGKAGAFFRERLRRGGDR
ncbi:MAG: hypothetical protein AB1568_15340 [Thermodesulfobacteriota bacterium]